MSFSVLPGTLAPAMSFTSGDDLLTNVVLSLTIRQGEWWFAPEFGLKRRPHLKNTAATERLVQGDIEEALRWLIDIGRASAIKVATERDLESDRHRLKATITVTRAAGGTLTYEKFVEVV